RRATSRRATPALEVDHLRVRPPGGRRREHLIRRSGGSEHHTAIDGRQRWVDDPSRPEPLRIGAVPIEISRLDVATFRGDPLMRRQAFHVEMPAHVDAGARELQLEASWHGARKVLWRQSTAFHAPVAQKFQVESEDLEALEQRRLGPLRAAIIVEGRVRSQLGDVTASMFVDGRLVDRQAVADDDAFRLRHRPERSGTWPLRIVFESYGRTLYDSGRVPVACELLRISKQLPETLGRFIEVHGLDARLGLPSGADVASRLLERHGEDLDAYETMLGDIRTVLDLAEGGGGPAAASGDPPRPGRPLRVLVASWEVPCRRHGGGVYLTDLLQRLGRRHEITLVHGHGRDEEPWVDELRPHLHRVLSVPRQGQALPTWAFEPAIRSVCTEWVPELRSTIESEVFSGRYDLVDYCYRWMLPHASRADVPQVLTLLEDPFAARLGDASQGTEDDEEKLGHLDRLLLAFYFSACLAPRRFSAVTTVNAVDARWIKPLGGERVWVNGIGVDLEKFQAGDREAPERPRFVFVGNYRHPPSVDAARFAAEEVLPQLRRRLPGAELAIVGAHPTAELETLDRRDGVTVTGFVDDIRDWLRDATAFIAPIFTGAGTRVKVLEAMSSGVPVIGTPLAFQGIGGEDGTHYRLAETVGQFVDACQDLAQSRARAESISKAARHWVEAHHGLDERAREREEIWFQAARGARALPSITGGRWPN
ncbi:MAG: glycosyltransferase family 4 protein, partial [Acidobacteriota bacterium]